jgi:3-oxoacyl-[acyl-carrier protein] reductase
MTQRLPLPSLWDLSDRVAIITGAGSESGIGFASASALAQLGASVVVTATSERVHERAEALRSQGHQAFSVIADLTDEGAASAVVEATHQKFGNVAICVNNAGMTSVTKAPDGEAGDTRTLDIAGWRAAIARNLETAFVMSKACLPDMVTLGWGRIVNIASVTGPVMAMRGEPAYAAAKAGLTGLARALAVDYAAAGVTVNTVAPGWIETGSQTPGEARQGAQVPVGRSGTPQEIAATVAWLATPGAAYLTGQCLVVDGGNSIAEERA